MSTMSSFESGFYLPSSERDVYIRGQSSTCPEAGMGYEGVSLCGEPPPPPLGYGRDVRDELDVCYLLSRSSPADGQGPCDFP